MNNILVGMTESPQKEISRGLFYFPIFDAYAWDDLF